MGWRLPERFSDTYRLVFADPEFHGLEVVARRVTTAAMEANATLGPIDMEKVRSGHVQVDASGLAVMFAELGRALVSWNLEDDAGQLVPCTPEMLSRQDIEFTLTLLDAWMYAGKTQMPNPPPDPVAESDLPMELLSDAH